MTSSEQVRTALRLVNEINRHDVAAIGVLLARDHLLVEAGGREVRGPEKAQEAWSACFDRYSEYRIVIEDTLEAGPVVGMMGSVSGTTRPPEGSAEGAHRWKMPAAWKLVVRDGRVERFQIFADGEPVRRQSEAVPAP